MELLPKWVLPPTMPSVFDSESFTALEMTARVYGAMNKLIGEFNKMAEQVDAFEKAEVNAREDYETKVTKVIREFICSWEKETADIERFAETVINNAIQSGKIVITESYDPETESLNIVAGGET